VNKCKLLVILRCIDAKLCGFAADGSNLKWRVPPDAAEEKKIRSGIVNINSVGSLHLSFTIFVDSTTNDSIL